MKKFYLLPLFLLQIFHLSAWSSLMVSDPRNSWHTYPGTIEEASLSIHPKGVYMEFGLYLTFSAKDTPWGQTNDSLEVVMNFDLPEEAILIDSWLWIGEDIVRAEILDRWSASSIYEGIVKRRQDPSILTKKSATNYELRVFPMVGSGQRKVKITYLMPVKWQKNSVETELPVEIVRTSYNLPSQFYIFTWPDQTWKNPVVMLNDDLLEFTDEIHPELGQYLKTAIASDQLHSEARISFASPMKNGIFLSRYREEADGIYQLVINPNYFLEAGSTRKVAVLIDYDASNSNISREELLNSIKSQMLNYLNPLDSFNLIFSNLNIIRYSEQWIAATENNIQTAFTTLNDPLSSYSNLPSLLGNGIDFIKKHGDNGKILLISNSDNYGEYSVANTLIKDLIALADGKIQVHIADYQSISLPYYYFNNQYFTGNEYLYTNLSRLTGSAYFRLLDGFSLSQIIGKGFAHLSGVINTFDLHTDLEEGFCYSRYNISGNENHTYLNDMIVQVGKFHGLFPFTIEISGNYENNFFSIETQVDEDFAKDGDSTSRQIWTGQLIRDMEKNATSNDVVNNIIYQSISDRVLSLYTAFLCLEDSTFFCQNCVDETELVAVEDEYQLNEIVLTAYPNPFIDQLTIKLICRDPTEVKELAIYTTSGMLVHAFDLTKLLSGENLITWNGESLPSGMYFLIFKCGGKTYSFKMVKL